MSLSSLFFSYGGHSWTSARLDWGRQWTNWPNDWRRTRCYTFHALQSRLCLHSDTCWQGHQRHDPVWLSACQGQRQRQSQIRVQWSGLLQSCHLQQSPHVVGREHRDGSQILLCDAAQFCTLVSWWLHQAELLPSSLLRHILSLSACLFHWFLVASLRSEALVSDLINCIFGDLES